MLTGRQERFVAEYQVDRCGARAAIRAGYSPGSAKVQASRLLTNANIRVRVDSAEVERIERVAGSAEWVVAMAVEGVELAFATGQLGAVAPLLALLAKRHPEFRAGVAVQVDARNQNFGLPPGITVEDVRRLRDALEGD